MLTAHKQTTVINTEWIFRAEGRSRSAYISPEIERKAQKIKCTHVFVSIKEYMLTRKKFKWNVHRNRTKSRWAWHSHKLNHAFADWGHNYLIINAIESPSFDVTNGTTRVSDPLWSPTFVLHCKVSIKNSIFFYRVCVYVLKKYIYIVLTFTKSIA